MGFGLWVLLDNQSFIALLRKHCISHTQTLRISGGLRGDKKICSRRGNGAIRIQISTLILRTMIRFLTIVKVIFKPQFMCESHILRRLKGSSPSYCGIVL